MRWPVVLTVGGHDAVRAGFALAVLASWSRHQQADVHLLDGGMTDAFWHTLDEWDIPYGTTYREPLPKAELQRARHIKAIEIAAAAGARFCLSADDDVLPRPEMDLDVAAALMDGRPDLWMAAVDLPSCPLPHGADGAHSPPLIETGSVGGLRIIRVDVFKSFVWPAMDPRMGGRYDVSLCQGIRAAGGKVGAFGDGAPKHLRAQHLGEFVSTFEWPYPLATRYPRKWNE